MCCEKCMKMCGVAFLLLGIGFLLKDLGVWTFWNIQWYSAVMIVAGIGAVGSAMCPQCQLPVKKKK